MHDKKRPRKKPPRTVLYAYSRTLRGDYWVNTCPFCGAIQGDFFMYRPWEGPFAPLHVLDDSPEAFEVDLVQIAVHAVRAGLVKLDEPESAR